MKNNKSGFTLVELISVIVLLSVVLTIAALSVSSIQKSVKERQKVNLVSSIKVAAQRYVNDTGINKVFVETLINEGLIESDDETGEIHDPTNNKSLNCYYVDLSGDTNTADDYDIWFKSSDCNPDIINDAMISVKYCLNNVASCSSLSTVPSGWMKDTNVILGAYSFDNTVLNLSTDTVSYSWISPLSPDIYDANKFHQIKLPDSKFVNDVFEVTITKGGKTYTNSVRVKIDAKEPYVRDLSVTNANDWKPSKTISATIYDGESGLKAYKITTESTPPTSGWQSASGSSKSISANVSSNGTYYVWVKDQADNVNLSSISTSSIQVQKVDPTPPSCTNGGDNYNWTTNNVNIWWGCNDGSGAASSGCNPSYSGGSTNFTSTITTSRISSYIIKDNAGNSTTCLARDASIYIDKTKPVISSFSVSSTKTYNSRYVNVSVSGYDNHSGLDKVCVTSSSTSSGCSWKSIAGGSYTTSYTFASSDGSGETNTLYAFVKDKLGNISNASSKSYTLYTLCTQKTPTYGNWGSCSKSCGGGYKYRDINYWDQYFGSFCSTTPNGDRSTSKCNDIDCCSSTYSSCGSYGSCSTTCGFGTKSKRCNYYSNYNDDYCGYNYESTSCYEDDGCKDAIYDYYYWGCDEYYITECDDTYCDYIIVNGYLSSGTIKRSRLTSYKPSYCDPEPEPEPEPDPEPELEDIYDYRYSDCDIYYITTCDDTYCNYTKKNGSRKTGTIRRMDLAVSEPWYCEDPEPEPEPDYINDYRYFNCDELYITTCDATHCNYTRENGVYATGTVIRDSLKISKPSYCDPEPEPEPEIACILYAGCYEPYGNKYRMYITSNCNLSSSSSTCSKTNVNSKKYYISISNGTTCRVSGTFQETGLSASNNVKIENGYGYYEGNAYNSWYSLNQC